MNRLAILLLGESFAVEIQASYVQRESKLMINMPREVCFKHRSYSTRCIPRCCTRRTELENVHA